MSSAPHVDHVVVDTEECEGGPLPCVMVKVKLSRHAATAHISCWLPFFEWRLRRAVDRLTKRVFMLAEREKGWVLR